MGNVKAAARFSFIFSLSYFFMLWPITGIQDKYAEFFCKTGTALFHEFGENGIAMLKTRSGENNVLLLVSNTSFIKQASIIWQPFHKSSNMIGFFHTAFLLSLIIATPLSWRRKAFALSLGFMLISIMVMLKLYVLILYSYSISPALSQGNDPAANQSIAFWYNNFSMQFPRGYIVAVFLWLLLCMGKREWQKLNGIFVRKATNHLSRRNNSQSKREKKSK